MPQKVAECAFKHRVSGESPGASNSQHWGTEDRSLNIFDKDVDSEAVFSTLDKTILHHADWRHREDTLVHSFADLAIGAFGYVYLPTYS